jgi:hypothetical protein
MQTCDINGRPVPGARNIVLRIVFRCIWDRKNDWPPAGTLVTRCVMRVIGY